MDDRTQLQFRKAQPQDLSALQRMYRGIVAATTQSNFAVWDEYYPSEFLAEDIAHERLFLLADTETLVAAMALCDTNEGEVCVQWQRQAAPAIYVERLGVSADWMRRGIGETMLRHAEVLAKRGGAQWLRLFVVQGNVPATRLYEKCGFVRARGVYHQVIDEVLTLQEDGFEKEL